MSFKGRFGWPLLLAALAFSSSAVDALAQPDDIPALPPLWSAPAEPAPSLSPATPFLIALDTLARERAASCLATAVYYEASNQPREGQEAVAQVVLNRVRHPNYPKSVCGVVYQGAEHPGCQFTFACDGSLKRTPSSTGWRTAQDVADHALNGFVAASVGHSTHYHTTWVHPAWSATMTLTRRIGAHQFYKYPGDVALTSLYAGVEPAIDFANLARGDARGFRRALTGVNQTAVRAEAVPQAASFSAWGLQIATVTPQRGGALSVADVAVRPASAVEARTPAREAAAAVELASGS